MASAPFCQEVCDGRHCPEMSAGTGWLRSGCNAVGNDCRPRILSNTRITPRPTPQCRRGSQPSCVQPLAIRPFEHSCLFVVGATWPHDRRPACNALGNECRPRILTNTRMAPCAAQQWRRGPQPSCVPLAIRTFEYSCLFVDGPTWPHDLRSACKAPWE